MAEIIVESEDLYNHPNLAKYQSIMRVEAPLQPINNNENAETPVVNETVKEPISQETKTAIVAAVGGAAGGAVGLGVIELIFGFIVSKKRKKM